MRLPNLSSKPGSYQVDTGQSIYQDTGVITPWDFALPLNYSWRHQAYSSLLPGLLWGQTEIGIFLAKKHKHWSSQVSSRGTFKHLWVPAAVHPGLLSPAHSHHSKSDVWKLNVMRLISSYKNLVLCDSSPKNKETRKMELPIATVTTNGNSSLIYYLVLCTLQKSLLVAVY